MENAFRLLQQLISKSNKILKNRFKFNSFVCRGYFMRVRQCIEDVRKYSVYLHEKLQLCSFPYNKILK